MIKKAAKGVYPSFQDELKCLIGLVNFKKGEYYKIDGFGTSKGKDESKFNVWYIIDLSNPRIQFVVKKETMEMMIDKNMITQHYKN